MCLSKVFIQKNGERELLMEEVSAVNIEGGKLLFSTLFGEQKEINASISEIDFTTHSIVLTTNT